MSEWTIENGLKWRALEPFGAEVDNDLRTLQSGATNRLVALFKTHALIIARGQALSMQQQIALMELIGPMLPGPDGNSYISTEASYGLAKAELSFHSDYAFTDHPLDALSLHAVDVVDGASSTRFANAERACTALSTELRSALRAYTVDMVFPDLRTVVSRACEMDGLKPMISTARPCIVANPRTGRECIGVGEMHSLQLIGLDRHSSRRLLKEVFDCLYAKDNVIEHVWRRGDLVMWDNITLQHARGSLETVGRRVLQRVAVGEKSLAQMYPKLFEIARA